MRDKRYEIELRGDIVIEAIRAIRFNPYNPNK